MRPPAGPLVSVVLLLTACGSSSAPVASGPEPTATSTVETSAPDGPTTSQGVATTAARPRVTLPAGGPQGPVFPPGTPAYQLLTSGPDGCRQLLTQIARWPRADSPDDIGVEPALFFLYRSAANACLSRWPDAKADFDRLQALRPAPTFGTTCSSEGTCEQCHRLVLAWLTGQLEAFRRDPSYSPTITRSTGPSPCPAGTSSTTSTTRAVTTTTTLRR